MASLYRAGDCYLQGDDGGFVRVDGGAPACIVDPAQGRRIEQWLPITPGSHFFAGGYRRGLVAHRRPGAVPRSVRMRRHSSRSTMAPAFVVDQRCARRKPRPSRTRPSSRLSGEIRSRIPSPAPCRRPTRDHARPMIVAQSVAIAVGVVLLVPFPSALFNARSRRTTTRSWPGIARSAHGWRSLGACAVCAHRAASSTHAGGGPSRSTPVPPDHCNPMPKSSSFVPASARRPAQADAGTARDPIQRDFWGTPQGHPRLRPAQRTPLLVP